MSPFPFELRPNTAFDLHLHTSASDGRYPLDEVLRRCAEGGLKVVAITDHDLPVNHRSGPVQVGEHTLYVIAGAEISGVHDGREYHLLVYFPREVPADFVAFCRRQCDERAGRFSATFRALGVEAEPPAEARALTRLHMARSLVGAGVVGSTGEAFVRFLGDSRGHVPPLSLPFVEAIRVARAAGGLTSWAHPPKSAVEAYLPTFVEAGLQGLELARPRLKGSERKALGKLAKRHGLYITGGSDWHGWTGPGPGMFRVDAMQLSGFVEALLAA